MIEIITEADYKDRLAATEKGTPAAEFRHQGR